jgi:hypothetical protein
VLCLVTSPVVGSNAHKSLGFVMLLVRLFHVEHSVAVAAGAAFAAPLPWSPGGVGACELMHYQCVPFAILKPKNQEARAGSN